MAFPSVFLLFIFSLSLCNRVDSEPTEDKQALLSFLNQTPHENRLQWNSSDSACNWVGVFCDLNRSFVYSLRLPGIGLVGQIPAGTLGRLTQLRVLSLRSNRLSGPLPADFSGLKLLRNLYLQNNVFSGEFPPSLTGLTRLNRLDLSFNNFTGKIPSSVSNLTRLARLFLQNNSFSGNLPSINLTSLQQFNVSNNNLSGSIPITLQRFDKSSFAGNINLCGRPLIPCNPSPPPPAPSPASNPPQNPNQKSSKKLSKAAIIAISASAGGVAILLLLGLILFLCFRRHWRRQRPAKPPKEIAERSAAGVVPDTGTSSSKDESGVSGGLAERNKLVFFDGGTRSFDLEDLLRASAEVLGKGSMGTSYKAVLEEGTMVVVKRLKEVIAGKREFELQMEMLGKVHHENLVQLRAFYFSKDEKLLVFDFMEVGSLSSLLHGSKGAGRTPLDWAHRLKIAIAAGQGLAHLHVSRKMVHGNLKSSNILLAPGLQSARLSDYGLHTLCGTPTPPNRVPGYRAPELVDTRKSTFKSDVYSFGVLLLELLTGKAPTLAIIGEDGFDLPRWVQSVVREEWTAEVFDVELVREGPLVEEEMVQALQIALTCTSTVPDQRPAIQEVVRRIEEISHVEADVGKDKSTTEHPSEGSESHARPQTESSTV
ncbi:probable inactive receptor kinase At2g26730 [Magnolia sinica]|uniref:probable inactive receptor kinase At2g26730 n=1 Tax=Magnolia sinica TaxID=86752 RepID=UPI00265B3AE6|nr:probable inactive receptor kinase At2g26730 [Magnolia sinica]